MTNVAVASAQLTDRAKLTASETEGIIREDDLGCTIPIPILNVVDEGLDVDGS